MGSLLRGSSEQAKPKPDATRRLTTGVGEFGGLGRSLAQEAKGLLRLSD